MSAGKCPHDPNGLTVERALFANHDFLRGAESGPYRYGPPEETCAICGTDPRNSVHEMPDVLTLQPAADPTLACNQRELAIIRFETAVRAQRKAEAAMNAAAYAHQRAERALEVASWELKTATAVLVEAVE